MNDSSTPRPAARAPAARISVTLLLLCAPLLGADDPPADPAAQALAREVATQGWILFSAKTPQGDYDLFLSRPDGSARRNLTQTPAADEFGGRFTADGKKMLYRRQARGPKADGEGGINHDLWGAMGALVIANADGSNPEPQGEPGAWPWASWSPDAKRIACLYKREGAIRIFDLATRSPVKELPRLGIFQQLFWSGDGQRLCGTANLNGQDWNVVSIDIATGKETLLTRALNCTPDWFQGDATRVIYSNRTPGMGSDYGWTMLMQATADGKSRTLVYGERGRHVYYGCTSPDDRYVIFSVPESDGGTDAPMAIVRLADTPIIVPADYAELRSLYPKAKSGPVLKLSQPGFEPHWTYADVGAK
jgi:Tol biopolymer transport system component